MRAPKQSYRLGWRCGRRRPTRGCCCHSRRCTGTDRRSGRGTRRRGPADPSETATVTDRAVLPLTRPGGVQAWKTSTRSPSRSHVHGTRGFEWLYVLSGQMRLVFGQQGAVSAGDAIVSPSVTRPCCPTSAAAKPPIGTNGPPNSSPRPPTGNERWAPPSVRAPPPQGSRPPPHERGHRQSARVTATQQAQRHQPGADRDPGPRRHQRLNALWRRRRRRRCQQNGGARRFRQSQIPCPEVTGTAALGAAGVAGGVGPSDRRAAGDA
jgi:hypothetical protein